VFLLLNFILIFCLKEEKIFEMQEANMVQGGILQIALEGQNV
jgi:hypothetical protein